MGFKQNKNMNRCRNVSHDRMIVFGRYPVPGKTKTRLIPVLGPAGAADLQRRFTEKILKTAMTYAKSRAVELTVCFEGGSRRKMQLWLGSGSFFLQQVPGNLGDRMQAAFSDAFQKGARRVVLCGTDIPELKTDHLEQAFEALAVNDLVIGPGMDGGYWLIGMNRPADLFEGIMWGTGAVLAQTLALAKKQHLKVKKLKSLNDIDTAEDLEQLLPGWIKKGPLVSVIIPVLNEAAHIVTAINSARHRDAQIIVVDGGSTDATVEKAASTGVRVVTGRCGRAAQQNLGAKLAVGRVLLFLHADTLLPVNYVGNLFETLMNRDTAAGAFLFKTNFNHPFMKIIEIVTNIRSKYLELPYGDQALFVRKSVFQSVGGFPESPIAEDLFLLRRLSKYGHIRIAPVHAVTSGRRWKTVGLLRTTLINQIILAGCFLGISPGALAPLYRTARKK